MYFVLCMLSEPITIKQPNDDSAKTCSIDSNNFSYATRLESRRAVLHTVHTVGTSLVQHSSISASLPLRK